MVASAIRVYSNIIKLIAKATIASPVPVICLLPIDLALLPIKIEIIDSMKEGITV